MALYETAFISGVVDLRARPILEREKRGRESKPVLDPPGEIGELPAVVPEEPEPLPQRL
jgi:hypothetical protein